MTNDYSTVRLDNPSIEQREGGSKVSENDSSAMAGLQGQPVDDVRAKLRATTWDQRNHSAPLLAWRMSRISSAEVQARWHQEVSYLHYG